MTDDQQNLNAGDPGAGGVVPEQGVTPQNPAADAGAPGGDGGQQPTQGADELSQYKAEVRRLNRALAAKGSSANRPSPTPGAGADGENPFETPQGQYAITIKLATANLAGKLESVYSLYPEIPAEEVARIRRNPWAYVSNSDLYFKGDWEGAAEDIEYYLLDRAEALKAGQPAPSREGGALPVRPVAVNANPSPEPTNPNATPGSGEDQNPWTMPLNKLEQAKNKEIQRIKTKK